jgi:hypothetical protein
MALELTKAARLENEQPVYLRGLIHVHNSTKIGTILLQQEPGLRTGFVPLVNLTIITVLPIIIRPRTWSLVDMIATMLS